MSAMSALRLLWCTTGASELLFTPVLLMAPPGPPLTASNHCTSGIEFEISTKFRAFRRNLRNFPFFCKKGAIYYARIRYCCSDFSAARQSIAIRRQKVVQLFSNFINFAFFPSSAETPPAAAHPHSTLPSLHTFLARRSTFSPFGVEICRPSFGFAVAAVVSVLRKRCSKFAPKW